jgi:hypothetical protein
LKNVKRLWRCRRSRNIKPEALRLYLFAHDLDDEEARGIVRAEGVGGEF